MTIIAASRRCLLAASLALAAFGTAPAAAQSIEQVDPNDYAAIDADLDQPQDTPSPAEPARDLPPEADPAIQPAPAEPGTSVTGYAASQPVSAPSPASATSETYHEDDLIGAAEGVFGKGAEGVARMIEDLLKKQGEPNGYIVGREAGAAVGLGVRYGSGTLYHKIEGQMPVYWTGPSLGFDLGANASNTFVLVYNLYDTDELYERYPAGEGDAYLVGGLTASYLRKGDVVLIPIRMGAGVRLGINAGYMKFSRKQRWLPF
ncbi:EipA family protein [Croceibacterium aestuarii]|uniref:EipA family protein n=1 Tax=Croceibacterium aestuarii TaxID=3064139 RepID=UPI00272E23B4|nr:EipA family protein [Croceibacterium sp. D39]